MVSSIGMPFPPLSLPPLIGHRGVRAEAPENSCAGLRRAAACGLRWVEVDVMLSADGIPVLMHDATLERTSNGHGRVAAHSLAQLRQLDAGAWFAPTFAGEPIPTLEDALQTCLSLGLGINLELKPSAASRARVTAQAALKVARTVWPANRPPPLLSSFHLACLEEALMLAPDWPRGLLLSHWRTGWASLAEELAVSTLHVDATRLSTRRIARIRDSGRQVLAYTVNAPLQARALFAAGVTALFTDNPAALASALPPHAAPARGVPALFPP